MLTFYSWSLLYFIYLFVYLFFEVIGFHRTTWSKNIHLDTHSFNCLEYMCADNTVNNSNSSSIGGDVALFGWDLPLRKLRWDSKIWTTSLTQALPISGEEACNWKRTTLPSGLRDVSTKRASSPSTLGSTPRQLTWNISHLTSICEEFRLLSCLLNTLLTHASL